MKKIIWISITFLLASLMACQDNWDDFYEANDERQAGAEGTLYEVLGNFPKRYSKFLELVEKSEVDLILESNRVLTVWAPHNDYITEDIMNYEGEELKRFVLNHINGLAMYKTKLSSKNNLEMLSGKFVPIQRAGGEYRFDKLVIRRYDIAASNGVIHEIGGVMNPLKNIMEYINEAGPDFSIFRDSLWAYNDTIFMPELSFALGVNEVGQTIYDSVFVIENSLLKTVDPADESRRYTLFLPSNEIIEDLLVQTKDYYDGINREFLKADTMAVYSWLLRATFFTREIDNLSNYKSLTGVGGSLVRFDKQIVRTNYERVSNGVVYHYEQMYMPRGGLIRAFEYKPEWLLDLPIEERSKYYNAFDNSQFHDDANIFIDRNNTSRVFLSKECKAGDWVEVKTITKNIDAEIEETRVMPGQYKLEGRFYGWRGAHTKLYINGEPQTWVKGGTVFQTGTNSHFDYNSMPVMVDTVTIGERSGYNMLNIRVEHAGGGSANFIRFSHLRFTPVGDNY